MEYSTFISSAVHHREFTEDNDFHVESNDGDDDNDGKKMSQEQIKERKGKKNDPVGNEITVELK